LKVWFKPWWKEPRKKRKRLRNKKQKFAAVSYRKEGHRAARKRMAGEGRDCKKCRRELIEKRVKIGI